MIDARRRRIIRLLWREGQFSRSELHHRTGLSPNGIGVLVDAMLREGLLRESPALGPRTAAGRPRIPLEIDPTRKQVVGVALMPGRVEAAPLGLAGRSAGAVQVHTCLDTREMIPAAADLLSQNLSDGTLGVGVSVTGFFDPPTRSLLFSSATKGGPAADLTPIFQAAGDVPVVLDNDMHALAARWLLTRRADPNEDTLLVRIGDGHAGAAMLVDGRPNRGCAAGGNELGHTRFFVETEPCFCGHTGCLERIVSTPFLAMRDRQTRSGRTGSLSKRTDSFRSMDDDPALHEMTRYLACALANAVNFVRPHRLVLASPFIRKTAYGDALVAMARGMMLPQLVDHVRIDLWSEPGIGGDTAAWLAIAELVHGGWQHANAA